MENKAAAIESKQRGLDAAPERLSGPLSECVTAVDVATKGIKVPF